ncbi:MAG: glycosyltransferase family 2 protein [Candidatus Electrothrix scaldis]|nr:MAG: glycosyltransferase family 2 protein [Candidatus Electrothrix sp. GW3-3]
MQPIVTILLATYNGGAYLEAQLDSLLKQSYKNIIIIARDDGSSDNTVEILNQYKVLCLEANESLGAKRSFSTLLAYAMQHTTSDYFMFCDQDDVWNADKVELTLAAMQEHEGVNIPTLVHTDVSVVDETLQPIATSLWQFEYINPHLNSLNRLLMHNTITGCTAMINRALAQKALPVANEAIMHDWWLGLAASQFGTIVPLQKQTLLYRQHQNNDTGAKAYTLYNVVQKAINLFKNDPSATQHLHDKTKQAQAFLTRFDRELPQETRTMLDRFGALSKQSFWGKRLIMLRYKILKYGFVRNVGLLLKL